MFLLYLDLKFDTIKLFNNKINIFYLFLHPIEAAVSHFGVDSHLVNSLSKKHVQLESRSDIIPLYLIGHTHLLVTNRFITVPSFFLVIIFIQSIEKTIPIKNKNKYAFIFWIF